MSYFLQYLLLKLVHAFFLLLARINATIVLSGGEQAKKRDFFSIVLIFIFDLISLMASVDPYLGWDRYRENI